MTTKSSTTILLLTQPTEPSQHLPAANKQAAFDHQLIKRRIEKAGYDVIRIAALSNATGNQYWLFGGGVVTVYNTGTVVVGGKLTEQEETQLKRKLRKRRT